jgi:tetratricopeptide (TPR) repeat protein
MEESIKSIESSIILSNKSAVENLRKEKYDHAIFFLNQALLSAKGMKESDAKANLLAMTYNNLGCYLKRLNKLSQALEYFKKSSELSKKYDFSIANVTCSHLNISKIYSEQGNHELALRHALKSLFLLRHNFATKNSLVSSLIIAYQTVGIEYNFLQQLTDSVECFETGLNLSMKHLGKNHEVTLALRKSLQELTGKPGRSQSNQSKKRDQFRNKSARLSKAPSKLVEYKHTQNVLNKEKILHRIGRREIKAAVMIQKWWKYIYWRIKKRKSNAAKVIQKWWKKILTRIQQKKLKSQELKRNIIKKSRVQGVTGLETKNVITEKEKSFINGSSKLLEEIKKNEIKGNEKSEGKSGAKERLNNLRNSHNKSTDKEKLTEGVKIQTKPGEVSTPIDKQPRHETPKRKRIDAKTSNEKQSQESIQNIKDTKKQLELPKHQTELGLDPISKGKNSSEKSLVLIGSVKKDESFSIEDSQESSQKRKSSKRNYLKGRRADITHQINSLIKIQSFMRMVPAKLRFAKLQKSVILIQSAYRGYLIRKLYQAIRDAVIFIQYMYRKYKSNV